MFLGWSCALSPITDEDGSGVDVPEVITLQYSIIDNSTILRLDTGEQLDIIYTEDSTLVVTMNGSQTSTAIPGSHNEPFCKKDDLQDELLDDFVISLLSYIVYVMYQILMFSITSYNIVIHILYKKLRNPIGKLLLLYSVYFSTISTSLFMIGTFIYMFPVSSDFNHMCYILKLVFVEADIGYEAIAACMLAHTANHMRQSYKMVPVNLREDKILWRRYVCYILGTMAISLLTMITYNVGTTKGRFQGFCSKHDPIFFVMITLMHVFSFINAPIQIALFTIYLYYWYMMRISQEITGYQINKKIFRIAIAMGATICFTNFFAILDWILASGDVTSLSL